MSDSNNEIKKSTRKPGLGVYIFCVLITALIAAVCLTQYRLSYFKEDLIDNIKTVNTSILIQEYRVWAYQEANKNNLISEEKTNQYMSDMQSAVNEIQKEYNIAVFLEQGAVIGTNFFDLTPELRKRLYEKGHHFLMQGSQNENN